MAVGEAEVLAPDPEGEPDEDGVVELGAGAPAVGAPTNEAPPAMGLGAADAEAPTPARPP